MGLTKSDTPSEEVGIHMRQRHAIEMPKVIAKLDGYKQALFSSGDQYVVMNFSDKDKAQFDQLRDDYPDS